MKARRKADLYLLCCRTLCSMSWTESWSNAVIASCGMRTIATSTCAASEPVMKSVSQFITSKLKLKVNEEKSAVARPDKRKFLSFSFLGSETVKRHIAAKAIARFKQRVGKLTRRTRGVKVETMVAQLSRYLRGWRGYFGFCQTPWVLRHLEGWLRRRLRAVVWKQWKRGKVRFAELRKR